MSQRYYRHNNNSRNDQINISELLQNYLTQYDLINRQIVELTQMSREIMNDIRYIYRSNIDIGRTRNNRNRYGFSEIYNDDFNNWYNQIFDMDLNFNDVIIRPTGEQIQNATTLRRYRDIQEPLNESCPITLERFTSDSNVRQINGCQHVFNDEALLSWFNSNVRCPVCRMDIRNGNIPTNLNSNNNDNDINSRTTNNENNNNNNNVNNTTSRLDQNLSQRLLNILSQATNTMTNNYTYDDQTGMIYFDMYIRPQSSSSTSQNRNN